MGERGQTKRLLILSKDWKKVDEIPLDIGSRHFVISPDDFANPSAVLPDLRSGDMVRWMLPVDVEPGAVKEEMEKLRSEGINVELVYSPVMTKPRIEAVEDLDSFGLFETYANTVGMSDGAVKMGLSLLRNLSIPGRLLQRPNARVVFECVELEGYGPFLAPVQYNLAKRGIRVISGRNEDSVGSDSNGAGKTTLVMAPLWALTGGTDPRPDSPRGLTSSDVINPSANSARVTLEGTVNGKRFVIQRVAGRRPALQFELDGEDLTCQEMRMTQDIINEHLDAWVLQRTAFHGQHAIGSLLDAGDRDFKEEQATALLKERKEKEAKKELIKQAKKLALLEEQATKKKKVEEEMERLKKEEEEKFKAVEEEEVEEEVPLERNVKRERGESSGTKKEEQWMEKKVSEWVAKLSLGEEDEAMLYVPRTEQEAVMRELQAEEDPLCRATMEEEKRLEWKLRLTRERRQRLEAADKMEKELRVQDDGNGYRPVEFMSVRMPSEKVTTSTYERELYALRQALDDWKHYLLGRHFKVYSDHETLRWLKTQAKMTPKLTRWAAEMDQFDFELKPVKGKYNVVVDALSRRVDYFGAIVHYPDIGRDVQQKVKEAYVQNPIYSDLLKRDKESPEYEPAYRTIDGLLFEKTNVADRLYAPNSEEICSLILGECHDTEGHFGWQKTLGNLVRAYTLPGMKADCIEYVRNCKIRRDLLKSCEACQESFNVLQAHVAVAEGLTNRSSQMTSSECDERDDEVNSLLQDIHRLEEEIQDFQRQLAIINYKLGGAEINVTASKAKIEAFCANTVGVQVCETCLQPIDKLQVEHNLADLEAHYQTSLQQLIQIQQEKAAVYDSLVTAQEKKVEACAAKDTLLEQNAYREASVRETEQRFYEHFGVAKTLLEKASQLLSRFQKEFFPLDGSSSPAPNSSSQRMEERDNDPLQMLSKEKLAPSSSDLPVLESSMTICDEVTIETSTSHFFLNKTQQTSDDWREKWLSAGRAQIQSLQDRMEAFENFIKVMDQVQLRVDGVTKEENPYSGQRGVLEQLWSQRQKEEEERRKCLEVAEEEAGWLRELDTACGLTGIQSYVLEGALAELQHRVTGYLEALSGGTLGLSLSATRQAKTTKNSVERIDKTAYVRQSDGTVLARPLRQLSGGERRRQILAMALGYADFASERTGVHSDLIVLDEVLQHLDMEGRDRVISLLRAMDKGTVLVVSQAFSDVAEAFDMIDWVIKRRDTATIECAEDVRS
ncbi:hypothetical protein CBR_g46458 [Chara braunii]|uniref:Reverse transcriptase RNase H-like domain-containing protein n=1 Tax=Chara braunii TaxID=69332 RepID=A0A388M0J0_CHABU|nr:hypothetical protein CBR_g46458 [Chara braunii]|eukprot:GBG88087.1 hypothetical protein CBR_g46458 [Chara braunii]